MRNRLVVSWGGLREAWRRWRGTLAARHAYEAIDVETVRDLGLCRSE